MTVSRRILFISKGVHSASTRYRALNYFNLFEKNNWQAEHLTDDKSLKARQKILKRAKQVDVVVVVRRSVAGLYAYLLRRNCKKLIFDFDDAIFLAKNNKLSGRPKRFKSMVTHCDHIWAGNQFLANAAEKYNRNVTLVPTSIDIKRYKVVDVKEEGSTQLVWIGSRSTRKYLLDILPALESAGKVCKGLTLNIIADFETNAESFNIKNIPWSADTETKYLSLAHIGIAPMKDTDWSRGKCGLKVLQYMASGLPVITSPVGANKDMVINNITGLYATTDNEWVNAIQKLHRQEETQKKMGHAGYNRCLKHYTIEQAFNSMLKTLESL